MKKSLKCILIAVVVLVSVAFFLVLGVFLEIKAFKWWTGIFPDLPWVQWIVRVVYIGIYLISGFFLLWCFTSSSNDQNKKTRIDERKEIEEAAEVKEDL